MYPAVCLRVFCLSFCLSIFLSVLLSPHFLSVQVSVSLFVFYLSVPVYPPVCVSAYLIESILFVVCLFVFCLPIFCQSFCLTICPSSVCLFSIYPSVSLSICPLPATHLLVCQSGSCLSILCLHIFYLFVNLSVSSYICPVSSTHLPVRLCCCQSSVYPTSYPSSVCPFSVSPSVCLFVCLSVDLLSVRFLSIHCLSTRFLSILSFMDTCQGCWAPWAKQILTSLSYLYPFLYNEQTKFESKTATFSDMFLLCKKCKCGTPSDHKAQTYAQRRRPKGFWWEFIFL